MAETGCLALVEIRDFPSVPDEATATRFGDSLKRQRAVGSFLSYYYNERGEFISGENDFAVRIPLGTLRHCPKIIGLARWCCAECHNRSSENRFIYASAGNGKHCA